ncbi:hypothetical protein R6Q59_027044 [Mikania micrantha]
MMFSASVYNNSSTSNRTSTSVSEEAAATSTVISPLISSKIHHEFTPSMALSSISNHSREQHHLYPSPQKIKKKRNLPGNPAAAAAAGISITDRNHPSTINNLTQPPFNFQLSSQNPPSSLFPFHSNPTWIPNPTRIKPEATNHQIPAISLPFYQDQDKGMMVLSQPPVTFPGCHVSNGNHHPVTHLSATALLQKAATVGAVGDHVGSAMSGLDMGELGHVTPAGVLSPEYHRHLGLASGNVYTWQKTDRLTRDFLGLTGDQADGHRGGGMEANVHLRGMLTYAGGIEIPADGFGAGDSEAWGNC